MQMANALLKQLNCQTFWRSSRAITGTHDFPTSHYYFYLQPVSSKRHKLASVPIEDSDQPAHLRCLISVVDGRSMASQGSNVSSSGKLRLWSGCGDAQTDLNFPCTHMSTCTWAQHEKPCLRIFANNKGADQPSAQSDQRLCYLLIGKYPI